MQQGLGLQIAAKQQLKISTQLVATMETLAASNEELREKIKKEAESNPVIKVIERTPSYSEFSDRYIASSGKRDDYSDTEPYDPDDSRHNWIEGMVSGGESLEEHLLKQLGEIDTDDRTREAAEIIITALDKNGFLPASPLMILPEKLWDRQEDALAIIQAMDPAGVGASDWRESLIIQAKDKGLKGKELKIFSELVLDCLDNLRQGKTAAIAKQLRTDEEEILALSDFLKTLTPFPGREYSSEWDQYITPDISIKKEGDVLRLRINSDALPSVELDPEYTEMLSELKKDGDNKDASKFLKEKISSAESLIAQLEARTTALEKLGAMLMDKQKDFFLYGPLHLKGLTMKEAAEIIGVHEATVSRIANSKYIDTDWGIYPIRSLFSNTVESADGQNISKNAVKEMIRKIISENETGKPLSDQKISDILKERGITAARRTVSKYRKELNIDSSFERGK